MDTGPGFREEHTLAGGMRVVLRHIRPEDAAELKRAYARLSPASRYRRFFGPAPEFSEEQLRYLTCVDGKDHVAIVAETPEGAGLGVARFVRSADDPEVAEAAVTVVDDAQGKGVGYLLSITLARAAFERGVKRFRGRILADNARIRQLLDEVGAKFGPTDAGGGAVFEVELQPTPFAPGSPLDVLARRVLQIAATALPSVFGPPRE